MPTILEELKALLGEDAIKKIDGNETLSKRVKEASDLYTAFETSPEPTTTTTTTATTTTEPVKTAAATVTTEPAKTLDLTPVLAKLKGLEDTLGGLEKKFVGVDKLPEYRREMLADALYKTSELSDLKADHRAEFSESLDIHKLDDFMKEQQKAGAVYPNLTAAYNQMVADRRMQKKIEQGVADGIKQKQSSTTVPAQTTVTAQTPMLELIGKAHEKKEGGQTAVQKAAEKLRAMRVAREAQGTA